MVALRGLTQSIVVIGALVAAQSMPSGAVSPAQGLGGRAPMSAGKLPAINIASPRATATEHRSALSRALDPSQVETSVSGNRGFATVAPQALSKRQQLCQNAQATTGVPIPRQMGPSDLAFLERARALVKSNDIAAARLIFTRLANNGVAEAAFELGRTYDPDFLRTIPIAGLEPDREVAWQWYKRAAALGNADAKSRLAKLKIDTGQ
jgi:TPR repeat protein